jgi:outer membrane receptor protein involved in Fe transport
MNRKLSLVVMAAFVASVAVSRAAAQGTTTGAIGGLVTDADGKPTPNARIEITNPKTGFLVRGLTRDNGRYFIQSLEVGGPYTIIARRIGFEPVTRNNIIVSLGETTPVDVRLTSQPVQLSSVQVLATAEFSSSKTGVGTSVTDSLIRRIPTLNRDVLDLVKLSPHVATQTSGGPSAAGGYNRFNNFTIDGANQNDRFGLGASAGTPGGAMNGRVISIDAVKEFQVLLTPADVRYGNFAGMLVNAVTKSGTNELHGGGVYAFRDPDLGASEVFLKQGQLKVKQFGFNLGGPIIRDRLHFFIAPEWQTRTQPSTGPYVGKDPAEPGQFDQATIDRIAATMNPFFPVGEGGLVRLDNPLTNLSGRLDWRISPNHRLVLRQLYNKATQDNFSRNANTFTTTAGAQNSGFRLGSNSFVFEDKNSSSALQLFSYFANGASNEFLLGYNTISDERIVPQLAPEISVKATNLQASSTAAVTFGTEQFSPGNLLKQKILEIGNNYTRPMGTHTVTLGGRFERTGIFNNFCQRCYGVWAFSSIDSLVARTPLNYSLGFGNGGPIAADFHVAQYSLYAQDVWNLTGNLSLTYGLRADVPQFQDTPAENAKIADAFVAKGLPAYHTSGKPDTHVLWSPRVGFNWSPGGNRQNQVRGTVGLFTGSAPLIMIGNAYANTGLGLVTLNCSGTGVVPTFTTDVNVLPRSCAGQPAPAAGQAGTAGVNLTDPNFKYPQNFTASLGFDRELPAGLIFTLEGLYRKAVNGVLVRDLNLVGPRCAPGTTRTTEGTCPGNAYYRDPNGRVLYADTISATGAVTNNNQRVITSIGSPAVTFSEGVIYVTNQSRDFSYSISPQLRKEFGSALNLSVGYTYMRSKDLQSLTSDRAISNWRNAMQYTGLETDLPLRTSAFERRHRFFSSGTYTLPWQSTDFSFYYSGSAGFPIVYTANGDLNGDGFNGNDPIYIPKDLTEATAMMVASGTVTPADQAGAFDRLISANRCLQEQRGKIMEADSCRTPWSNRVDLSFRQTLPEIRGQRLTAQLDVFNFMNLLGRWIGERQWGQTQTPVLSAGFPQQQILTYKGPKAGSLDTATPTFNLNANTMRDGFFTSRQTVASNFYQMQLTMRYSF